MAKATFYCPPTPQEDILGKTTTFLGCGRTFEDDPARRDGQVMCPHCGYYFDPRDEDDPINTLALLTLST